MKIRLQVRGELVINSEIPDFKPRPDVILWGERVFHFVSALTLAPPICVYEESFAYYLVDGP